MAWWEDVGGLDRGSARRGEYRGGEAKIIAGVAIGSPSPPLVLPQKISQQFLE